MINEKLLNYLSPKAVKYIDHCINSCSNIDYLKIKKLSEENVIKLKNFTDVELDIIQFDWVGLEQNRNWWWQMQALPFLNWSVNSYHLQSGEEQKKIFEFCVAAIENWVRKTKNSESPLVWHDHASAFRVRNIVNWMVFYYIQGRDIVGEIGNLNLARIIMDHLDWLYLDKNYSEKTNHGFDQSMILLTISMMFDHKLLEPYRVVSKNRLKNEIQLAFTEEGVHKENSPGYQKFMLQRMKQLDRINILGEKEINDLARNYIDKAEKFLSAITLPNGKLPMVGDTFLETGVNQCKNNALVKYNYSESDYFIVKGKDNKGKDIFVLFKNSHFSDYHRHDDDLMLFVFYDGEVVLGDAGLYSHEEGDVIRKFCRSYCAHSIPFINNEAARSFRNLKATPKINVKGSKIVGISYMFGVKITRTIDLSNIDKGIIKLYDKVDNVNMSISANFFIPRRCPISISKNRFIFRSGGVAATIDFDGSVSLNMIIQGGGPGVYDTAIVSKSYELYEEATRVVIRGKGAVECSISLEART